MGVPAIPRMEERNLVGVCHLDVVNVLDVLSMPDELGQNVTGDVVLHEGKSWSRIYFDDDGGLFTERIRMVQGAQLSDATMSGTVPKHRLALSPHLWSLKSGRYLVRAELRNGEPLIMGRPETGASGLLEGVTAGGVIGTDRNEARVVFSLTRRLPVPFHNGTVPEPEEGALAELIPAVSWATIESYLTEGQLTDAEASICEIPEPALAQLKDSAGANIGSEVTIPPGGPTTVTAPDGAVQVKDSAGTNIGSPVSVKSNGTANATAPDGAVQVKDSAGTNIGSPVSVKSNGTANATAPDGAVQVKDSAGTNIGSPVSVKSNGTANATVADSTITKPDGTTAGLLATAALDVRNYRSGIVYQRGRALWSGQTTVYTTGDEGTMLAAGWFDDTRPVYPLRYADVSSWLVLTANNLWGNTNRFTDTLGTQSYANQIVQDHLTGYEWYIPSSLPTGTFASAIAAAVALSYNGHSDWKIAPLNVLQTIVDTRPSVLLNYAPFNIPAQAIWSSTTNPSTTTAALPLIASGAYQSTAKATATPGYIYVRKFV